MKNLLGLLLCIVWGFILIDAAYCQETRTESMGGVGLYMKDYTNIHLFPSALAADPMLATIEMPVARDFDTYSFGSHFQIGRNLWAVYLNRPVEVSTFGLFSLTTDLALTRQAEVYFGRALSAGTLVGGLTFARDALSSETVDLENDETVSDVGFKVGLSRDSNDLGLQFHLINASRQEKTDSTNVEDTWGGYRVQLVSRFWMPVNELVTFVPLGLFTIQNTTFEPETGLKTDFSTFSVGLGGAVNLQVTEGNLLVAAIEVFSMTRNTADDKEADFKTTTTTTTLPAVFVGVESRIRPWLTGRFGVNQIYGKTESKVEIGTSETTSTSFIDNFRVVFGFGLNFGSFSMDATFNEGLLFSGPNFISGADEPVSSRLSISYKL